MALESFKITRKKALQNAECQNIPKIMVIAGPNGVGKSTLLFAIKQKQGDVHFSGQMLYLSPHRIWRRQQIHVNNLWEPPRSYSQFLMQDSISGFGGLRILDGNRAPDSADESPSAVKYTLSQVETRKQTAVNLLLDTKGSVTKEEVGDIYSPVRDLTKYLLPHLSFCRIDTNDRNNVKCLWQRVDSTSAVEVDLDDLSSGERAIVSLFMPFLERLIEQRLRVIEAAGGKITTQNQEDLIVLIDEPELHLHPALQARLLDYLRDLTYTANIQFVLATHSPTLLTAASYEELYVLMPPTNENGQNQLRQLATSSDRLQALRDLCGDTYILTSCRNIICVEGEAPSADSKIPTDLRLLELIMPEMKMHVLLPFGGKGNTIEAARRLSDLLPGSLPIISVAALVDADQNDSDVKDPLVIALPVAMIENLLLLPLAIWDWLSSYKERINLRNPDDIDKELKKIAYERRDNEVRLRIQKAIKTNYLRVNGHSVELIKKSLLEEIARIQNEFSNDDILHKIVEDASKEVEDIIKNDIVLQKFHGKGILRDFHRNHVNALGIGYTPFVLELARIIGQNEQYRKPIADSILPKLQAINSLRKNENG